MNVITLSVREKAGNAISVGNNRACSNGGGGENECGNVTFSTERGGYSKKPLCNGDR